MPYDPDKPPEFILAYSEDEGERRRRLRYALASVHYEPTLMQTIRHYVCERFGDYNPFTLERAHDWLLAEHGYTDETAWEVTAPDLLVLLKGGLPGEYRFELVGENWRLQFEGEGSDFKDILGFRYIPRLLEKRDHSINALDLRGIDPARIPRHQADSEMLTEETKADYNRRLSEIRAEKEKLGDDRTANDNERERLEKEEDAILEQMKAAAGLTGRSRKMQTGNAAMKAHDSVEKAIKAAISKIKKEMPKLAEHLKTSIKTESGVSFAYRPRQPAPAWKISY